MKYPEIINGFHIISKIEKSGEAGYLEGPALGIENFDTNLFHLAIVGICRCLFDGYFLFIHCPTPEMLLIFDGILALSSY